MGQDIRRLAYLAYLSAPSDVRETLATEQFIDSLFSSDMGLLYAYSSTSLCFPLFITSDGPGQVEEYRPIVNVYIPGTDIPIIVTN